MYQTVQKRELTARLLQKFQQQGWGLRDSLRRGVETPIQQSVAVENADGAGRYVIVCDHASNDIPSEYADLGLTAAERAAHIAWDPGALGVAQALSKTLDAPLVRSTVSRLVIDCNRDPADRRF